MRPLNIPAGTASDVIARTLKEVGCRYAFGIPGGEVIHLIDALARAGIEFVLTKHENAAGFMAEGVYYADGAPGILVTTLGPGLTNAVTAIANAMQERAPLIVLTGCVDPVDAVTYTHQVLDHGALLAPITKARFTAVDGAIEAMIEKAILIALDERPGPVHIDIPVGVANAPQVARRGCRMVRPALRAPARGGALDDARRLLVEARRPVLIAGLDVANQRCEAALAAFADKFSIPVITTYKAKGVLPEDHELSLGAAGLSPKADELLLPFVRRSDLALLIGYDPIEMRLGWRQPFAAEQPVIELAAVPNTHFMHQARLNFVTDIAAGLDALSNGLNPHKTGWDEELPRLKNALTEAFGPKSDWGPANVIETARAALPRDTIATADSGAHRILLSQMWRCFGARDLRQSSGLCTMGCALPLAMAAKLAQPERRVVAFIGDAGLEMGLGELATARSLGLTMIVFVFVDASLALIELKQRQLGLPNLGVDFARTDFADVATALGCTGVSVSDREALEREIDAALARAGVTVIACEIGSRAYDGLF